MSDEKIVWLVSYPRSGSNWVRTILSQLALGSQKSTHWAIPAFNGHAPLVGPTFRYQTVSSLGILKTHVPPDSPRMQWIPNECVGVISIFRHPLDILLSSLNYARFKDDKAAFRDGVVRSVEDIVASGEIDAYIEDFCRLDGLPQFAAMCGSLSGYQAKWDSFAQSIPHLRICYEDMVAEPDAHVAAIQAFFGAGNERDPGAVRRIAEEKTATDGQLFWKKKAFNFEQMLDAASIERACKHFEPTLQYLGYEQPTLVSADASGTRAARTTASGVIPLGRFQRLRGLVSFGRAPERGSVRRKRLRELLQAHRTHVQAGEYAQAASSLEAVVAEFGYTGTGIAETRLRWDLAQAYLRSGTTALGEEQLQQLVRLEPRNPKAHYMLGLALSRLRRPEPAVLAFKAALELADAPEMQSTLRARIQAERAAQARAGGPAEPSSAPAAPPAPAPSP